MSMNFPFVIIRLFYCALIMLMTSCSGMFVDNTACCINNGNLDYLKTDELCEILVPDDLVLPFIDQEYNISNMVSEEGALNVGKRVNICPPCIAY